VKDGLGGVGRERTNIGRRGGFPTSELYYCTRIGEGNPRKRLRRKSISKIAFNDISARAETAMEGGTSRRKLKGKGIPAYTATCRANREKRGFVSLQSA